LKKLSSYKFQVSKVYSSLIILATFGKEEPLFLINNTSASVDVNIKNENERQRGIVND